MFYVYEWFVKTTNEIFYVGKGCKNRYKQTTKRNKMFQLFLEKFDCESRIIETFESEEEAFLREHERIMDLKSIGQAKCNLDYGGKGGNRFCWTQEMREYKSIYNPMKLVEQKKRMSTNNPMKNPEIAKRVTEKISKPIYLNSVYYPSVKQAHLETGHAEGSISKWCRNGYDHNGNPCRYASEEQKEIPNLKKLHPKAASPKAVYIDDIYFDTVMDGAAYIGCWSENLIKAIKQNRKCKGHICRYANQQPSQTKSDNSSLEGSTTNG